MKSVKARLALAVYDAHTDDPIEISIDQARLLDALWAAAPAGWNAAAPGVEGLRMRLGWSRGEFDEVRHSLHRADLLHEAERPLERGPAGQIWAGRQPFILRPLVRRNATPLEHLVWVAKNDDPITKTR